MTRLFDHRYPGEGPTGGHSFGNLFITALHQITGDFPRAVRLAADVLRVRGAVLPATGEDVQLVAEGRNGRLLVGETAITHGGPPRRLRLVPPAPAALSEALEAIAHADLLVLGPGSLYTSIIPNVLVPGLRAALARSRAQRVYVANLVTQPGETDGFNLARHVAELTSYAAGVRVDVVLANSSAIPEEVADHYRQGGAEQVVAPARWAGPGRLEARPLLTITADGTVRHHPDLLAAALAELAKVATWV